MHTKHSKTVSWLAIACGVGALAACGTDSRDDDARRLFIQKASRALHPSAPELTPDEVDALLTHSDEQIVADLYADPQTRDAVFGLSLAFVGAPVDQLHRDGQWAEPPFDFAPAASAARAFRDGEDPLPQLFTTRPALATGVVAPVREDVLGRYYLVAPLEGTTAQRRAVVANLVLGDVDRLRASVATLTDPIDQTALCDRYQSSVISFIGFEILSILGVPTPVIGAGRPAELNNPDTFPFDPECVFGTTPTMPTRAVALARIDHTKQLYAAMFANLEPSFQLWEAGRESAFEPIDLSAIGFTPGGAFGYVTTQFYSRFWNLAQNSSTNYNRRRGAYMLDRYFCDDLKPVGAALPTTHVDGKHATDPACAACHFKLDPMAGFFRRNGLFGTEFDDQLLQQFGGSIIFDDGAFVDYKGYEAAWKSLPGSGRTFDVGYIRSTRDETLNSYGSTLADLDGLLKTAPEVERCFVQRMFEYFNGKDQAVDPGFLDDVTSDMHAHTADRLQQAVTRILTAETFRAPDRNSTVCYDLAPGTDTAHRPPCEVASILRTNCTSCHGGGSPQAGLDLTVWERSGDGEFGFRHVVGGTAIDRGETFVRMLDRVKTSDLTRQMPQAKDMPLRAREELALWLQRMVEAAGR